MPPKMGNQKIIISLRLFPIDYSRITTFAKKEITLVLVVQLT